MITTDNKILNAVIDSFTIEDLEHIISKKKSDITPIKLSNEEIYKNICKVFLKRKLFAPIYK